MMPRRSLPLRLTALATASALALATAPAAWSAPPPIPPRVDPPSRVARLSRLNGSVSFHTADADSWSPASLNYPSAPVTPSGLSPAPGPTSSWR